jgi:hypothetical protein
MALQIFESDWRKLDEEAAKVDRLVFYGAAVSSFLEISIDQYTASLRDTFASEPEVVEWLERVWAPEERAHGQAMRTYLARVWPQYGWGRAYAGFIKQYAPLCNVAVARPTPAREMLTRCVTECEAAMLYRTLSSLATDQLAKNLFAQMYEDEIAHYRFFYQWFHILRDRENLGAFATFNDAMQEPHPYSDEEVGAALAHINAGFVQPMPFSPLEPHQLQSMARIAVEDRIPLHTPRAMMLKPLRACSGWGKPLASAVDMFHRLGHRVAM